jgi:GNAT superfamily N-acetyltransferase
MKLERVAILDEARGRGLGVKLMEFLVQYGKQKDVNEMNMHA